MDIERVPPNSIEAERAVLGAILLNNDALSSVHLRADQFYRTGHQEIFKAMNSMDAKGMPIDIITLSDALKESGALDRAGGAAYITSLTSQVPSSKHAEHYAKTVEGLATKRAILNSCHEIAAEIYENSTEVEEITNKFIDAIDADTSCDQGADPKQVMGEVFAQYESIYNGTCPPPLLTGYHALDDVVTIVNSDLIVIAGNASMGKTSVAMAIARKVAAKKPVAIYTLEMTRNQIGQVFVAQQSGIPRSHMRKRKPVTEEGWAAMHRAFQKNLKMQYRVFDKGGRTPAYIRKTAKLMKKKQGLGLIVIDYLQLLEPGVKLASRTLEVGYMTRTLKALAKELDVPVVLLCQLNRSVLQRPDKKPHMGDLRDSGEIEQDADTVILVYRPEKFWPSDEEGISQAEIDKRLEWQGIVQLLVDKQRAGETGVVKLKWDGPATNIHDLDQWHT